MKGRLTADWDHTSALLCQFANAHREKGKPASDIYTFHPHRHRPKPVARPATPADLERLFGKQQP